MQIMLSSNYSVNPGTTITKEDVWGKYDDVNHKIIDEGMVVARQGKCPIFGDELPYKSVTLVCTDDQLYDVLYWIDYVHGANSVSKILTMDDGIAIRSDYMAW